MSAFDLKKWDVKGLNGIMDSVHWTENMVNVQVCAQAILFSVNLIRLFRQLLFTEAFQDWVDVLECLIYFISFFGAYKKK